MTGFPAFILLGAMLATADPQPEPAPSTGAEIVAEYVEAYNARDLQAMADLMHPEIQWLSIEGAAMARVADGKQDLTEQMRAYLASGAATTSEIAGGVENGDFIAVREIASWSAADGSARSQSALAVYEIDGELVRRVWYYPASQ